MIKRIVCSLLLGCALLCGIWYYTTWVNERFSDMIRTSFEQLGNCTMHSGATTCSLAAPRITFEDVYVSSCKDQSWQWYAQRYSLSFSWLYLLLYGMLDIHITIEGLRAHSSVNDQGSVALMSHIAALMSGEEWIIPTFINAVTLTDAKLSVDVSTTQMHAVAAWSCHAQRFGNAFHATMHVKDGLVQYGDTVYGSGLRGSLSSEIPICGKVRSAKVEAHGALSIPLLPEKMQDIVIAATWDNEEGHCTLTTNDPAITIQDCTFRYIDGDVVAECTAHCLVTEIVSPLLTPESDSTGMCTAQTRLRLNRQQQELHADYQIDTLRYSGIALQDIHGQATLTYANALLHGTLSTYLGDMVFQTALTYDPATHHATIHTDNSEPINFPVAPQWTIQPHHVACDITSTSMLQLNGSCTLTHQQSLQQQAVTGSMSLKDGTFDGVATSNGQQLIYKGNYQPSFTLHKALYNDTQGNPVIRALTKTGTAHELQCVIDVPFLQSLLKKFCGIDLQGEGNIHASVTYGWPITGHIALKNGTIRLPGTYNFIRSGTIEYAWDHHNKICTLQRGSCQLDKGSLTVLHGRVLFDETWSPYFACATAELDRCILNLDQGIFASLSGWLHAQHHVNQGTRATGHLFIDQAHLEGNIFSHVFQKTIALSARNLFTDTYWHSMCDISCESIQPVHFKTAFLELDAQVDLRMLGMIQSPTITGKIDISSGSFFFPYKPLFITRGSLIIDSQQPGDSFIDVMATNKIKKHTVTMHVSGSLLHNSIMLSSSPPLSEEQIVSLLLVGSQEESLSAMMPALIMQNLSHLMFDQSQSSSELGRIFTRFLKPFENVHFVPSFADQSGRGGLRGTLELEITDRLRATIQKNFSLLEDTRFEVEYTVSDDITVRGLRNERRDLGGEVEVRWKF